MDINLKVFNRKHGTRIRKLKDKYYLIGSGCVYELNDISAIIIKYIGKSITINELSHKIVSTYMNSDINIIENDISNFLNLLIDNGIIEKDE